MSWHRNPGPGPTWITDEELREAVSVRGLEAQLSERLGGNRPLVEDAEEALRFLECLPGEAARARRGSVLDGLAEQVREARERGLC
jgi:hypothetical protein